MELKQALFLCKNFVPKSSNWVYKNWDWGVPNLQGIKRAFTIVTHYESVVSYWLVILVIDNTGHLCYNVCKEGAIIYG